MSVDTRFRMFVDEVGNADMGSSANPNHRYLSLTGIIVDLEHYQEHIDPQMKTLKRSHFGSESVVLHRREMLDFDPPFDCLKDSAKRDLFERDWTTLMIQGQYSVITVVIDKKAHLERYTKWHYHPYHYCMECLLERYVKKLRRLKTRGDVMAESRNRIEDEKLKVAYKRFFTIGSRFERGASEFLSTGELKLRKKAANVNGLQFADLIANPSFRSMHCERLKEPMTARFGATVARILDRGKYEGGLNGAWGSGKKWLP